VAKQPFELKVQPRHSQPNTHATPLESWYWTLWRSAWFLLTRLFLSLRLRKVARPTTGSTVCPFYLIFLLGCSLFWALLFLSLVCWWSTTSKDSTQLFMKNMASSFGLRQYVWLYRYLCAVWIRIFTENKQSTGHGMETTLQQLIRCTCYFRLYCQLWLKWARWFLEHTNTTSVRNL